MFRKPCLALDIGNKNTKMVCGAVEKNRIRIHEYGISNTPDNSIKDGKIINPNAIADTIKEFIKKHKVKAGKMVINITGTGVITRDIQLPKSTDEEISKMLKYDVQQYFPVDLENYVLDFKVLEEVANHEGVFNRIILAAVPIQQAEEYMKIPKLLNMEMQAIDLPANSVSKFLSGTGIIKNRPGGMLAYKEYAVLDIGFETTGVYIFYEDKLRFNRILLTGSGNIDNLIINAYDVGSGQAEERKIVTVKIFGEEEEAGETRELVQLCNVIRPAVNNLIIEINRFFDFYNSRGKGNRIQMIYLCGGGSKLNGLDVYISSYFNIPVKHVTASDNIIYTGVKKQEEFKNDYAYLHNAIGAVVRSNQV